jgi:hypothetical protein
MKISKYRLKQIIKEELKIFEAEMVVRGGPRAMPTRYRRSQPTPFNVSDTIRGQSPSGQETQFDYKREYVPPEPGELAEMDPVQKLINQIDGKISSERTDPNRLRMLVAVRELIEIYSEGEDLPPAIKEMAELAMNRDFSAIHANFNRIWRELSQWHKDGDTKFPRQVPANFRSIDTIARHG